MVVEVDGDGEALEARLGAGERHLLVRDEEGRVGRGRRGAESGEEEEGAEEQERARRCHGGRRRWWTGPSGRRRRLCMWGLD